MRYGRLPWDRLTPHGTGALRLLGVKPFSGRLSFAPAGKRPFPPIDPLALSKAVPQSAPSLLFFVHASFRSGPGAGIRH
ncbi:hypothetical protein BDW71DRAFT_19154 [Aspergillus fruticulosus]